VLCCVVRTQIAEVGCGAGDSEQDSVGILGYLFAFYGLLGTTGADPELRRLGRKKLVALELELVDIQSGLRPHTRSAHLDDLREGVCVFHEGRGSGRIVARNLEDSKPYRVQFDSGEVHSYSEASAGKLRAVALSELLVEGARVTHSVRGGGYIIRVILDDARGKPYHVMFDSGEFHSYSAASAMKLIRMIGVDKPSTTNIPAERELRRDQPAPPTSGPSHLHEPEADATEPRRSQSKRPFRVPSKRRRVYTRVNPPQRSYVPTAYSHQHLEPPEHRNRGHGSSEFVGNGLATESTQMSMIEVRVNAEHELLHAQGGTGGSDTRSTLADALQRMSSSLSALDSLGS
jgi:hypothetical protein